MAETAKADEAAAKPESGFSSKGDTVLVLDSGTLLPVHSAFLELRSQVMPGSAETQVPGNGSAKHASCRFWQRLFTWQGLRTSLHPGCGYPCPVCQIAWQSCC